MYGYGLRPQAREVGLVVQGLGEECLVYDRDTNAAHCLTSFAARVWNACDGEREVADLAQLLDADEDLVVVALGELTDTRLLVTEPESDADGSAVSRRHALKRMAKYGAGAAALPLIISATVGTTAAFASGGTTGLLGACTENDDCSGTTNCVGIGGVAGLCLPVGATVNLTPLGCSTSAGGNCEGGTCTSIGIAAVCVKL